VVLRGIVRGFAPFLSTEKKRNLAEMGLNAFETLESRGLKPFTYVSGLGSGTKKSRNQKKTPKSLGGNRG
jgi:hypothetical protein